MKRLFISSCPNFYSNWEIIFVIAKILINNRKIYKIGCYVPYNFKTIILNEDSIFAELVPHQICFSNYSQDYPHKY